MKIFRIIFYYFYSHYLIKRYAYKREKFEDRDVLERIIFPYILSRKNPKKVLDIGREDYEEFYNKFFIGKELWTIDIDPKRKEFGAENHVVDNVVNLKKHFKNDYFDLIIMNGVFGWGLNEPDQIEKTFSAIYDILKKDGIFVFGWNDIKDLTPVPLNQIKALKKFQPYFFKPLKSVQFKTKTGEHTYNFFIKK